MDTDKAYRLRASRKNEHIKIFMQTNHRSNNGFGDVVLQNNALPEVDFDCISTKCSFLGKTIDVPIMINAVTGGTEYALQINKNLAQLSAELNIPMALGSQTIAIQDKSLQDSFRIAREVNKEGVIIANVSANSSLENVYKAIEMISADAVQLHLNAAQEICMAEGDRNFKGILANITDIVKKVNIPVIVKEVGFGISYETAKKLYDAGVRYIDTGGKGGTNFITIEGSRNKTSDCDFLKNWGISTAQSLLECKNVSKDLHIICSGGITKAEDIAKAIAAGASLTGISGFILRRLIDHGYQAAKDSLEKLEHQIKVIMLLLGAEDIEKLSQAHYMLKGELYQLYKQKFT